MSEMHKNYEDGEENSTTTTATTTTTTTTATTTITNVPLLTDSTKPQLNVEIEVEDGTEEGLLRYTLTQIPPIPVSIFVSMQHLLLSLASALTISTVIADTLCADTGHFIRARLFATSLAMSGICTICQTLLGIRLPVFQGPSSSFLVPLVSLSTLPGWKCPEPGQSSPADMDTMLLQNGTELVNASHSHVTSGHIYTLDERLQQLSGSLMVASLLEIVVGGVGFIRPLMRLIGPLTVAPCIGLIGLSLYRLPVVYSKYNPGIALGSAVLVIVFSLYLAKIQAPLPSFGKGGKRRSFPIFQLFPILLAMIVMWALCAVLTVTNVFPDQPDHMYYLTRTDAKLSILKSTPWLQFTYPGQFGPPSFNVAAIVGFLAATVASLVESVGDYYAAAKCCQVMPPPDHAISRGILVEGLGSFLSGAVGAAHATTSYSGSIAMLSLTKTASRSVLVLAGIFLIILSMIGKVGATLATLPPPILGGILLVVLGLLAALGISTLNYADMSSNRNLLITGIAFMSGFSIPTFMETHGDMLETGNTTADQVIRVVLGTPMFLGGIIALFLDNTVPGTDEERGLLHWKSSAHEAPSEDKYDSGGNNDEKANGTQTPNKASSTAGTKQYLHRSNSRKVLSEDDVYWFGARQGWLRHGLWRYIPFVPHRSDPRK